MSSGEGVTPPGEVSALADDEGASVNGDDVAWDEGAEAGDEYVAA
jgi:hypothetical protein